MAINLSTEYLIISVEDSGIGISKENLQKLFRLFSTIKNSESINRHGVGLGLMICKRICESMNGYILAKSVEGEGSTFVFSV